MAILAVASDLGDLKERINNITVAFDRSGKPVTCGDLELRYQTSLLISPPSR